MQYVLKKLGIEFLVVSRNALDAENFIQYREITPAIIKEYHLIVNATPIGM